MEPAPRRSKPDAPHAESSDALDVGFAHSTGRASHVDVIRLSELRVRELDHSIYAPTRLDFHQLHFVTSCAGRHWSDFEPVDVCAGDVLHVRMGQVHAYDKGSTHDAWMLLFSPRALAEAYASEPMRWEPNRLVRPAAADFEILLSLLAAQVKLDLHSAEMQAERVGPHILSAVLRGLAGVKAARLGKTSVGAQRADALVAAFEALLDAQHATTRSTEWYASKLSVTQRTLARACQRARGSAPKRMIDQRVALEAKRLLSTSIATVEAIGLGLGFSEATNFVKFFRRLVGETPEAFRQRS